MYVVTRLFTPMFAALSVVQSAGVKSTAFQCSGACASFRKVQSS